MHPSSNDHPVSQLLLSTETVVEKAQDIFIDLHQEDQENKINENENETMGSEAADAPQKSRWSFRSRTQTPNTSNKRMMMVDSSASSGNRRSRRVLGDAGSNVMDVGE
jgi:hypothetical protein